MATEITRSAQEPGVYWKIEHLFDNAQDPGQTERESIAQPETFLPACDALTTNSASTHSNHAGARHLRKRGFQGGEEERRLRMLYCHVVCYLLSGRSKSSADSVQISRDWPSQAATRAMVRNHPSAMNISTPFLRQYTNIPSTHHFISTLEHQAAQPMTT